MKRKILLIFSTIVIFACLLALSVSAISGTGIETDPYVIETAEDFVSIKDKLSAYYKLDADISVSSTTGAIVEGAFTGVFDGNGHKITVNISAPTDKSGDTLDALFGVLTGTIKNLTVDGSVSGSNKVAGIVGKVDKSGLVDNCMNYATVYGRKNVGGIAGVVFYTGSVTNCANYGAISGKSISKGVDMGGIVGCTWYTETSYVTIKNCYNEGTVEGEGYNCGGVVGYSYAGKIVNCFNVAQVTSTASNGAGSIIGKTEPNKTHSLSGYISLTSDALIGDKNGTVTIGSTLLESAGVAIYLGSGSGIRGEFHVDNSGYEAFCRFAGIDKADFEYGSIVSTKEIVASLNGDLFSEEALASGKVAIAPAIKNGEKQYFYVDENKGEGYHSFRFALTGFPDTRASYNMEFVIVGYMRITDAKGNTHIFYENTVKSDNLASNVEGTGLNAVSIVRVAEVTLKDGDFEGNETALGTLNHIVALKDYTTKIEIDGVIGYGHKSATFTKSISSGDTVVFQIINTDADEFIAYISALTEGGYEKISENEINGNTFYTFKSGDTLINAAYTVSGSKATISRETVTALPENMTQPSFDKVTEPSITQIKLEASVAEGMSYVIELSDGTFLIIDGGWCDNNEKEADKLYNTLAALAGENSDIVIAGWIFTHCHGDHVGTFNIFAEKYHADVKIKQLLYNFPADVDISNSGSAYMMDDSKQRYTNFKYVISTYLADTETVKLHSGYKFYYADAEIEILQTLEDLYPQTVANYDFNSSSTIFTVTVAGQKMLFLGDVSDVGVSRLNTVFGTSLKSDFLQVAHHGLNNGGTMKTLYVNADPTYVLYPAPLSWFNSNSGASANFFLQTESKTVKQIFVSGAQTTELYLPYDGMLYEGEKLPGVDNEEPDGERVEVSRPSESVDVPDAYFDLDLSGGEITDSKGHATVTVTGGGVVDTTVSHGGVETTASAFTGDRYKEQYYLTLSFNEITSDSEWGEFVMGSSTFEIFLKLDNLPGNTVGLITSCNGGGMTLYLRKQAGGQLNFQIGSTKPNSNSVGNYSAAADMNGSLPIAEADKLLHIVGSYDKATNMMKLYINGMLVASADYGEGSFLGGSGNDYVIGIGYNPQYSGECLSSYADYELYEVKIYNVALTDEQVAQEYWNCIDNLSVTEAENE